MSKLPVLVRLHKSRLDEARTHLAECERLRGELADAVRDLDLTVENERGIAARSLEGRRAYPPFARGMAGRRAALERSLAEAAVACDQAAELVAARFRELKTLELARSAELERARAHEARLEQAGLDEIAANRSRRKAAGRGD